MVSKKLPVRLQQGMFEDYWSIYYGTTIVGQVSTNGYLVHSKQMFWYEISPGWRGLGIGTKAVKLFIELMKEKGKTYLLADVHEWNINSQRLLESCGFNRDLVTIDRVYCYSLALIGVTREIRTEEQSRSCPDLSSYHQLLS